MSSSTPPPQQPVAAAAATSTAAPSISTASTVSSNPSSTVIQSSNPAQQVASPSHTVGTFGKKFPRIATAVQKIATSRTYRFSRTVWTYKRSISFGFFLTYAAFNYAKFRRDAYLQSVIHPDTYLVWKIHDGSIVETKGAPTLGSLLHSPSSGEEPPQVMEMFEVVRALKWAQRDDRIRGIFADFSNLHLPSSVTPNRLGLAQIEELMQAIHEFKMSKREQFGDNNRSCIAWADTFNNQASYLLATAFDEVWVQPSGRIPLTGLGAQIPFFKKVLDYFGIKVHTEARKEYKSMVSTFNQTESLPPKQLQNEVELIGELNRGLMYAVGVNRFPDADAKEIADKLVQISKQGPFSSNEATELGLINGACFKRDLIKRLLDSEPEESPKVQFKSFGHFNRITNATLDRILKEDGLFQVGVVYLLGSISSASGEFSASSVIKGLKEAAEDKDISSIILRIDSGGGDVVASEAIWDAVRRVRQDYGKTVIASFSNAAASGGYYAASACDVILACENTITGSIGVASIRPTISRTFFDKFNVSIQSFFTGSTAESTLHEMDAKQKEKHSRHVDEMYDNFLSKVCDGRGISRDMIEDLAGGRVMTGLSAWVKSHPHAEVEMEAGSDKKDQGSTDSTNAAVSAIATSKANARKVRATSLTSQWKAKDVTQPGDNNTILIERVGPTPTSENEKEQGDGKSEQGVSSSIADAVVQAEEAVRKTSEAIIATKTQASSSHDNGKGNHESSKEKLREGLERAETKLAVAAFEAAEASRSLLKKTIGDDVESEIQTEGVTEAAVAATTSLAESNKEAQENKNTSKNLYGNGLIDSIGGIWDSAYYAMTMTLTKELEELITKQNLTLEQAAAHIRPSWEREIGEDGTLTFAADLHLKRFPEEKPFWKRVKESMGASGDGPQLFLLPSSVSNTISLMLEEAAQRSARAAIRMMIATAADPSGIASAFNDKDLADRIRASNGAAFGSSHGTAKAEYPFASFFS